MQLRIPRPPTLLLAAFIAVTVPGAAQDIVRASQNGQPYPVPDDRRDHWRYWAWRMVAPADMTITGFRYYMGSRAGSVKLEAPIYRDAAGKPARIRVTTGTITVGAKRDWHTGVYPTAIKVKRGEVIYPSLLVLSSVYMPTLAAGTTVPTFHWVWKGRIWSRATSDMRPAIQLLCGKVITSM